MHKISRQLQQSLEPIEQYHIQKFLSAAGFFSDKAMLWFLLSHVLIIVSISTFAFLAYSFNLIPEVWLWVFICLAVVFGLGLPSIYIYIRRSQITKQLNKAATSSLEIICVCSEFGSSIDDMVKLVAQIMHILKRQHMANFMEKLYLDLNRLSSRPKAWQQLQKKLTAPEFTVMIKLLSESDQHGASMIKQQRSQIDTMRSLRAKQIIANSHKVKSRVNILFLLTFIPIIFIMTFVIGILPFSEQYNSLVSGSSTLSIKNAKNKSIQNDLKFNAIN